MLQIHIHKCKALVYKLQQCITSQIMKKIMKAIINIKIKLIIISHLTEPSHLGAPHLHKLKLRLAVRHTLVRLALRNCDPH